MTLLFFNVYKALKQGSWIIMLCRYWWMKNQKTLYHILVSITFGIECMFGVNNIAISSIRIRKNVSIDKIIKKINEEFSSMCAANGFYFICNDMIDVSMIWKDGLHLTNDGTKMLANNFLKY